MTSPDSLRHLAHLLSLESVGIAVKCAAMRAKYWRVVRIVLMCHETDILPFSPIIDVSPL